MGTGEFAELMNVPEPIERRLVRAIDPTPGRSPRLGVGTALLLSYSVSPAASKAFSRLKKSCMRASFPSRSVMRLAASIVTSTPSVFERACT
jgi:hypothetical protein